MVANAKATHLAPPPRGWTTRLARDWQYFALCYLCSVISGVCTAEYLAASEDRDFPFLDAIIPVLSPLWAAAAATFVSGVLVIYCFSLASDNASCADLYWSLAPPFIASFWWQLGPADAPVARFALILGGVLLWGVRLTYNWGRMWEGMGHEDWRYVDIRKQTGKAYWLGGAAFVSFHLVPALLIFVGLLPVYAALALPGAAPVGPWDASALALNVVAVALEAWADNSLDAFVKRKQAGEVPAGALLDTGPWGLCRHPNYLGEMLFWSSLFLYNVGACGGSVVDGGGDVCAWARWSWLGFATVWLLFVGASVGLKETRMAGRREPAAWARYLREVPMLLPVGRHAWRALRCRSASAEMK